jgi:hypothetical protein
VKVAFSPKVSSACPSAFWEKFKFPLKRKAVASNEDITIADNIAAVGRSF